MSDMSDAETQWIEGLSRALRERGVAGDPDSLSVYFAEQRAEWFATPEDARPDPNPLINGVGAIVGDLFVQELGLRWVVASDEYGVEAAVSGSPGEILVYPMNAVAKRWTPEAEGNLADYIGGTLEAVRTVRRKLASG